jgi:hypothetical protein
MFPKEAFMSSLESVWEYREEKLYPGLFGEPRRGIFPLEMELFTDVFKQEDVDPRWLHLGVIEFAPSSERSSWLYVTSGGSTPWETDPSEYNPEEYSWLGVEFVIEAPEQADWPIIVLKRLLAYHVLLCHGRFGNATGLDYGDRIPIGGPIDGGKSSTLRYVAIAKPRHYPSVAQLDSGKFDFLQVVGITEGERDYAKSTSTEDVITFLEKQGAYPVTDPGRTEVEL